MEHPTIIRPASLHDIQSLLVLEALFPGDRLSRRSLRHLLLKGNAHVLVFETEGAIAGNVIVLYRQGAGRARIYSLAVDPSWRRQGIAKALLERAIKAAKVRGCHHVVLEVRADNETAQRLYQSLGFSPKRCIDNYYEDHSAAVRLEKMLTISVLPMTLLPPMPCRK